MAQLSLLLTTALLVTASGMAQQFDELVGASLPRTEPNPRVALLTDLDGDGDADLVFGVAALLPGEPLQVYVNEAGVFRVPAVPRLPQVAVQPSALAAGDVDGDGHVDLLVGGRDGYQDRLYLGSASGVFRDATASALPQELTDTRDVRLVDVDGDGDLDALLARDDSGCVLLRNDGQGVFVTQVALSTVAAGRPVAIFAGNFDPATSGLEIAAVGRDGRGWLWLDDGQGGYVEGPASWFRSLHPGIADAAMGDVDGDGDADLVLARAGRPDLLLRNDAAARTFQAENIGSVVGDSSAVELADIDADGDLDVVLADLSGPDRMLRNRGDGTFVAPSSAVWPPRAAPTRCVTVADVDGDLDLDLLFGRGPGIGRPGRFDLLSNEGNGDFFSDTGRSAPLPYRDTTAMVAADFDGDGHEDLVIVSRGVRAELWRGERDGTLDLRAPQDVFGKLGLEVACAVAADVDGDGDIDLLLGGNGRADLYLNDGTGALTPAPGGRLPAHSADVTDAVFFDADGDTDLDVYLVTGGASVQFPEADLLWRNDGAGTFTDVSASHLPGSALLGAAVAAGDVDGDGDIDLLVGNRTVLFPFFPAQPDELLLNDGQGRFIRSSVHPLDAAGTRDVELVDLDGDGDLDAITVCGAEPVRVLLNDGAGRFIARPGALPGTGREHEQMAIADLDEDGVPDVAIVNYLGPIEVFSGVGDGRFVAQPADQLPLARRQTTSIACADFDSDGDLDLALGSDRGERDVVLRNLVRHVDVPLQPRNGRALWLDVHAAGAPGAPVSLYLDLFLAPSPIAIGSLGLLQLEPSTIAVLGAFNVPASGPLQLRLMLANDPTSVGLVFYLQGLVVPGGLLQSARLTQVTTSVIRQ